jgi:2-dehydropantoate 2-reductase
VAALRGSGVTVETPANIQAELWGKLALIAAFSGLCAGSRSSIGEMREHPLSRRHLIEMVRETAAVAAAHDVGMGDDIVTRVLAVVDAMPPDGTASMQRDIMDGLPSELEAIIGAIVRMGDAKGIATPTTTLIYACLLPQEIRARIAHGLSTTHLYKPPDGDDRRP